MARKVLTKEGTKHTTETTMVYPVVKDHRGLEYVSETGWEATVGKQESIQEKYQPIVVNRREIQEKKELPDHYRITGIVKDSLNRLSVYMKRRYDVYNQSQIDKGYAMENLDRNVQFDLRRGNYVIAVPVSYNEALQLFANGNFIKQDGRNDWSNEVVSQHSDIRRAKYADGTAYLMTENNDLRTKYVDAFQNWYYGKGSSSYHFKDFPDNSKAMTFCVDCSVEQHAGNNHRIVSDSITPCYTIYNSYMDRKNEYEAYKKVTRERAAVYSDEIVNRGLSRNSKDLDNFVVTDIKKLPEDKYAVEIERRYDLYDKFAVNGGNAGLGSDAKPFTHVSKNKDGSRDVSTYQVFTKDQLDLVFHVDHSNPSSLYDHFVNVMNRDFKGEAREDFGLSLSDNGYGNGGAVTFRANLVKGKNGMTLNMRSIQPSHIPFLPDKQQENKEHVKNYAKTIQMNDPKKYMLQRASELQASGMKDLENSPEFA